MQVKVYCPKMVEIPSEYLPALAKRAADAMADGMSCAGNLTGTPKYAGSCTFWWSM